MNAKERLDHYNASIGVSQQFFGRQLQALILEMVKDGLVPTIETVPQLPLAMGHYDITTTIRPSRLTGQSIMELEKDVARMEALEAVERKADATSGASYLDLAEYRELRDAVATLIKSSASYHNEDNIAALKAAFDKLEKA
jgi:hypothetical protein